MDDRWMGLGSTPSTSTARALSAGRKPYRRINRKDWPIYLGRAGAGGGRTGIPDQVGKGSESQLYVRILKHRRALKQASEASNATLKLEWFRVQWLAVDPAFIGTAEVLLIKRFLPVWNAIGGGFGSNQVGGKRSESEAATWDVLHPGRKSGVSLRGKRSPAKVGAAIQRVEAHLASQPWPFHDPYARL